MKPSVLTLLLAVLLAGCAPAALSGSDSVPPPASAAAPEEPAYSLPQAADVPPGTCAAWQAAYVGFLTDLRASEYQIALAERPAPEDELPSKSYALYDIDKDGIPELFLRRGTCEADCYTVCYTFQDGALLDLGSFQSGHSSLYTSPEENGVLFFYGHMGYSTLETFSLEDGAITPWETLHQETKEETRENGYTYPDALVPGAEYISTYFTNSQFRPADVPALVLPVYDYQGRTYSVPMEEAQVRTLISRVLKEDAPFIGVSGDGYYGDTGLTALKNYLQPKAAYPYGTQALEVKKIAWADVNGDGQTDCLLLLEQEEEARTNEYYTVLSAEDGAVYAYFFDCAEDIQVDRAGRVYFQRFADHWIQASFYKNQSYIFSVPAPANGDGLAWDIFS